MLRSTNYHTALLLERMLFYIVFVILFSFFASTKTFALDVIDMFVQSCDLTEKWGCIYPDGTPRDKCIVDRNEKVYYWTIPWGRKQTCPSRPGCLKKFDPYGNSTVGPLRLCAESALTYDDLNSPEANEMDLQDASIVVRSEVGVFAYIAQSIKLRVGECRAIDGIPTLRICARYALPGQKVMKQANTQSHSQDSATMTKSEKDAKTISEIESMFNANKSTFVNTLNDAKSKIDYIFEGTDPGYTFKTCLDEEGYTRNDPILLDENNEPIDHYPAKLCAYVDPDLLSYLFSGKGLIYGPDLFDWNPNEQPLHAGIIHPIVKIIIFIIKNIKDGFAAMYQMIYSAIGSIIGVDGLGKFMGKVVKFLIGIFELFASTILEALGKINRVVTDTDLGCVNLPIGPFPPNYCHRLKCNQIEFKALPICRTMQNGMTEEDKCINSPFSNNNAINNSVLISQMAILPKCIKGQEAESENQKLCIPMNGEVTAAYMHFINKDVVPVCQGSESGCITRYHLNKACAAFNLGENCDDVVIRPIYADDLGENKFINILPYYTVSEKARKERENIKNKIGSDKIYIFNTSIYDDKSGSDNILSSKQVIWGFNFGLSKEVSLNHNDSYHYNPFKPSFTDIKKTVNLVARDFDQSFKVAIKKSNDPGEYNYICVYKGKSKFAMDCFERAPLPLPILSIAPNSTHFDPTVNVKYSISARDNVAASNQVYESQGQISIPTIRSVEGDNVGDLIISGYPIQLYATDKYHQTVPFRRNTCINEENDVKNLFPHNQFLCGKYANNVQPVLVDHENTNSYSIPYKYNPDALYLEGLEFYQGLYNRGVEYICVQHIDYQGCARDLSKCVIAKKVNVDQSDNNQNSRVSLDINDRILPDPSQIIIRDSRINYDIINNNCYSYLYNKGINVSQCTTSINATNAVGDIKLNTIYQNNKYACNLKLFLKTDVNTDMKEISINAIEQLSEAQDFLSDFKGGELKGCYIVDLTSSEDIGIRPKTAYEMGLCVKAPPLNATCAATVEANVKWPSVKAGSQSIGSCIEGTKPIQSGDHLKRYCGLDTNNNTVFENIAHEMQCIEYPYLNIQFGSVGLNGGDQPVYLIPKSDQYNTFIYDWEVQINVNTIATNFNVNLNPFNKPDRVIEISEDQKRKWENSFTEHAYYHDESNKRIYVGFKPKYIDYESLKVLAAGVSDVNPNIGLFMMIDIKNADKLKNIKVSVANPQWSDIISAFGETQILTNSLTQLLSYFGSLDIFAQNEHNNVIQMVQTYQNPYTVNNTDDTSIKFDIGAKISEYIANNIRNMVPYADHQNYLDIIENYKNNSKSFRSIPDILWRFNRPGNLLGLNNISQIRGYKDSIKKFSAADKSNVTMTYFEPREIVSSWNGPIKIGAEKTIEDFYKVDIVRGSDKNQQIFFNILYNSKKINGTHEGAPFFFVIEYDY